MHLFKDKIMQGLVIALEASPSGDILETGVSFYSVSDNPIKRAEQVAGQFANGMKGWGKDRKSIGEAVLARGNTMIFKPIII
jgi:hypothetical protein